MSEEHSNGRRRAVVRNKEQDLFTITGNTLKMTAAFVSAITAMLIAAAGLIGTIQGKASPEEIKAAASAAAVEVYEEREKTMTRVEFAAELDKYEKAKTVDGMLFVHDTTINKLSAQAQQIVNDVREVRTDVMQLKTAVAKLSDAQDQFLKKLDMQNLEKGGGEEQ